MKLISIAMTIMVMISTSIVLADEINVSVEVQGSNTVVSCIPAGGGSIDKAYVSIFNAIDGSTERQEMDLSVDNRATYVLSGVPKKVEGRCKIFMADNAGVSGIPSTEKRGRIILQGEFSLAVKK
jgi:hypothetical protein